MGTAKALRPGSAIDAVVSYVQANYGCSGMQAAVQAAGTQPLADGIRALHRAVRTNLIRMEWTGMRFRCWPSGVTMTRVARDLRRGDWFIDPHREGRKLAKVLQVGKQVGGRAHFILDDETELGPWIASYDLRERVEIG